MKNVLVIGGTRLMGKHLVSELLSRGFDVTIATRGLTKDDFGHKVRRLRIDRTVEDCLRAAFSAEFFHVAFDFLALSCRHVSILLDHLHCAKYVMISTTAVYGLHDDMREEGFDPLIYPLMQCDKESLSYAEAKRQAEGVLFQNYSGVPSVAVRFPFVIGADDYTERLFFYVDHLVHQKPMHVDNYDRQLPFVRSDEAGRFLAGFAESDFRGAINGAASGTMSIRDVVSYITRKTGLSPVLRDDGDEAPYNGVPECCINTDKAQALGYEFAPLQPWIYDLLDVYLARAGRSNQV